MRHTLGALGDRAIIPDFPGLFDTHERGGNIAGRGSFCRMPGTTVIEVRAFIPLVVGAHRMNLQGATWLSEATVGRCVVGMLTALAFSLMELAGVQAADVGAHGRIPEVSTDLFLPPAAARVWRDVQEAIRDGEKLPTPDPEPYYSRAEIWSRRLENQEEALLDTLRGVEAVLEGMESRDPVEIDRALRRLRDAAWLSLQRPKSIYPGAAEQHYGDGLHSYSIGQFKEAAAQFSRAIQLDAGRPEYYYFRSLSQLSVGETADAIRDAERGAMLESRLTRSARVDVSRALMRVQGKHRLWLEGYRRGRPTYDPRRDETLPERLSPESRSPLERSRIEGARRLDHHSLRRAGSVSLGRFPVRPAAESAFWLAIWG